MAATLSDPALTRLLLVTLAEELPTTETIETIEWVEKSRVVGSPTIVTNRVLDTLHSKASADGPIGDMVALHRSLTTEQEKWLAKLPPDLTLPYLFGLFTPGEVAAHISDMLEVLT
jgi:hypothetical protein